MVKYFRNASFAKTVYTQQTIAMQPTKHIFIEETDRNVHILELSIIYFYKNKTTEPNDVPITERYRYYSLGICAVQGGTVKLHFKLT